MRIKTGQFAGMTTEEVLLKWPDWAFWMMRRFPDSAIGKAFHDLIEELDAIPFTEQCKICGEAARRATAFRGVSRNLTFWCDECKSYESDALRGDVTVIETFEDALSHVNWQCDGRRSELRAIIRALARGKGLPKRVGETQAVEFFNS